MITRDDARRLESHLLEVLNEDAHNAQRLASRLDAITRETGVGAHAALLMILTQLAFEEGEARRHWEAILTHRETLASRLGRDPGVRVAALDHFVNANRKLVHPTLIDLELFEAAERASGIDPKTGLRSDRAFRSAVQQELRRARRYGQPVAVVLFDLDDFAAVNAAGGPLVGDRVLREVAILLKNKIRDIDLAARPGEDEMALVLPETDRNGALLVAERFRREVEGYFARREVGGRIVRSSVSGGVAGYPGDGGSAEVLLERAAQALYRAKAAGRNAIHVFHPERRRYLRFDLEPGRFEVEVLGPRETSGGVRDLSRNGILFLSPERLEVGEEIEIRVIDRAGERDEPPFRAHGRVVRLEELPAEEANDRFEVGVAFDLGEVGADDLLDLLERSQTGRGRREP